MHKCECERERKRSKGGNCTWEMQLDRKPTDAHSKCPVSSLLFPKCFDFLLLHSYHCPVLLDIHLFAPSSVWQNGGDRQYAKPGLRSKVHPGLLFWGEAEPSLWLVSDSLWSRVPVAFITLPTRLPYPKSLSSFAVFSLCLFLFSELIESPDVAFSLPQKTWPHDYKFCDTQSHFISFIITTFIDVIKLLFTAFVSLQLTVFLTHALYLPFYLYFFDI